MHIREREEGGRRGWGEGDMRDPGKRKGLGRGGWMRKQNQFVVLVDSIDHLLIVVFEWASGD